jgi:hypothetical protein
MRGRQLVDVLVQRLRRGHVAVAQEVVERGAVDREPLAGAGGLDGFELGREREAAAVVEVVERLDPRPVSVELQAALARVPERDREHAVEVLDEAVVPLQVGVEHHLGVGFRAEFPATAAELGAQRLIAVDRR